jgi:hypothetical protein
MKTFKDLKIGDRIYVYQRMKIIYYTIVDVRTLKETSTSYTWDHKEIKLERKFIIITYKNSQNKENDIEFSEYELEKCESRTTYGRDPIFADREVAIKYVTDLYDYRVAKIEKLRTAYDKECSIVEKYKQCLKNIPD